MHSVHTQAPSNRLAPLRHERGVTLKEIADACGVYPSTVLHWQREDKFIPQRHHATVARMLDVSVPYLTGWASEREPYTEPQEQAA